MKKLNFESPENMGRIDDADGSAIIKGICGDTMEMYLKIEDGSIARAMFSTDGCISSRAAGATAANIAEGKKIGEVLALSPAILINNLRDSNVLSAHCCILAVNTMHTAIANYLLSVNLG